MADLRGTFISAAIALGLATTAAAVEVRGQLTIPPQLAAHTEVAGQLEKPYWEEWNGFLEPRPPRLDPSRELTVVLRGKADGTPVGCRYALEGGALAPADMVVKTGTTLRIENTDPCAHELYAEEFGEFGQLQTAPGNARTVTIAEAGSWPVHDGLYPHVRGHLHAVTDLVACGTIDRAGRYEFKGVEPGEYKLVVYYGGEELANEAVTIEDHGQTTLEPIKLPTPKKPAGTE